MAKKKAIGEPAQKTGNPIPPAPEPFKLGQKLGGSGHANGPTARDLASHMAHTMNTRRRAAK